MNKLIETYQKNLIVCDNENCDYIVANDNPTTTSNDIKKYLNVDCPLCGTNLLTEEDYQNSIIYFKVVDWINKYFSWITYFVKTKSKMQIVQLKINNGIQINKFDNELRNRYYGLRVGDLVNVYDEDVEVIEYGVLDNNTVFVKDKKGEEYKVIAELCEIITKVEDK